MKGIFINNSAAKDSIHESGRMVYNCLKISDKYQLDYIEVSIDNRSISKGYDFYFFNYHPVTMNWLNTCSLKKELGFSITMILEVAPNDPFVFCPSRHFDAYCALDPTLKVKNKNVYAFPRPLEKIDFELPVINNGIPVIGTFGFATKGKGFQHVVEAVNKEFDKAIIKINIPYGDFVPESKSYAEFLGNICRSIAKPGIEVQISHDFMNKTDLIKWCANNTLNCFLYDRDIPGLSATTDQAIVSERPLAVAKNETFRHILEYLPPYPDCSLLDSISKSTPLVKQMKENWSAEKFIQKFELLLSENEHLISNHINNVNSVFILPLRQKSIINTVVRRIKKYKRKLKKINLKILSQNDTKRSKKII